VEGTKTPPAPSLCTMQCLAYTGAVNLPCGCTCWLEDNTREESTRLCDCNTHATRDLHTYIHTYTQCLTRKPDTAPAYLQAVNKSTTSGIVSTDQQEHTCQQSGGTRRHADTAMMAGSGQDRTGQDRTGQDRTGHIVFPAESRTMCATSTCVGGRTWQQSWLSTHVPQHCDAPTHPTCHSYTQAQPTDCASSPNPLAPHTLKTLHLPSPAVTDTDRSKHMRQDTAPAPLLFP
jgi:hypothetical protein